MRSWSQKIVLAVVFTVLFGGTLAAPAIGAADPYEPDDTWATAKLITTDGAAQAHRLDPSTDVDWVKFTAEAGHPYRVTLNGWVLADDIYNSRLYLYDSDGTTVLDSSTYQSYDKAILYTATQSETLYVKVDTSGDIGDYTLAVKKIVSDAFELDNTWATAKAITTDGAAQTHRIDPVTDVDWVKFADRKSVV